jgi:hypothetical protein
VSLLAHSISCGILGERSLLDLELYHEEIDDLFVTPPPAYHAGSAGGFPVEWVDFALWEVVHLPRPAAHAPLYQLASPVLGMHLEMRWCQLLTSPSYNTRSLSVSTKTVLPISNKIPFSCLLVTLVVELPAGTYERHFELLFYSRNTKYPTLNLSDHKFRKSLI